MAENNQFYKQSADAASFMSLADAIQTRQMPPTPGASASAPFAKRTLNGEQFIELLDKNYDRIARNEFGISKKDVALAMGKPADFSINEYMMLEQLMDYFETICGLSQAVTCRSVEVISPTHFEVLKQFLVHCDFDMERLHKWLNVTQTIAPPPLCSP